MYGFFVTNIDFKYDNANCKFIKYENLTFYFDPLNKFYNDKLFYEDDNKIVLLDGVILNISELNEELQQNSWKASFDKLIENDENYFMDKLRGSFSGVVYFKRRKTIKAFTCHMGEKPVYYYKNNDFYVITSHIDFVKKIVNGKGKRLEPNVDACYEMLCTGSCLHSNTLYKCVQRILAGRCLDLNKQTEKIEFYHRFENTPEYEYSLDECIEKGDILFRQAVDRIFRKSVEYGYQPECDLSGGLDSRLATWVAFDLGYKNILNICYCVKNHMDHLISKKISSDLQNEYFFLPMGSYILDDVDKKVEYFGGQVDYTLCTGAVKALEIIGNNIGLCCTGLLGEIQNAYWVEGEKHTSPNYWKKALRSKFFELKVPDEYKKIYVNYEQMNLYELSGNFYMSSAIARQQKVEVSSPFIDVDYLDFIYRVPLRYRKNYKYVMAWIEKKYPNAAKYLWTTTGKSVKKSHDSEFEFCGAFNPNSNLFRRGINKVSRMLHLKYQMDTKFDMNPIEKWYREDKSLQKKFDTMFTERIGLVKDDKLRNDVSTMYTKGDYYDKIMVINLLSAFYLYMQ